MSTTVPPAFAPQPGAAPSPYSLGLSSLGSSPSFDFSQILTDQLLGQTTGSAFGLPADMGLASNAGVLSNLGLGSATSGAGVQSGNMMEELMALTLVMLVERLVDPASTSTSQSPNANNPSPVADGDAPPAVTNTADAPYTKWPVAGRITQDFHPGHTGTDIAVPTGTPIPTTLGGKVIYGGWNTEGYGNLVIVENGSYRTYYAHLSQINVKVGDQVAAGSQVGLSGSTGNSTGPHLHYEVRINGTPVPPSQLP